jgi:hypothetical protein
LLSTTHTGVRLKIIPQKSIHRGSLFQRFETGFFQRFVVDGNCQICHVPTPFVLHGSSVAREKDEENRLAAFCLLYRCYHLSLVTYYSFQQQTSQMRVDILLYTLPFSELALGLAESGLQLANPQPIVGLQIHDHIAVFPPHRDDRLVLVNQRRVDGRNPSGFQVVGSDKRKRVKKKKGQA